jgi:hypothetical protein
MFFVVLAAAGLAAGFSVPDGGARSQATTRVAVTVTESKFTLSRTTVPVGTVIFTVTNKGKQANNFKIAGKKTPLIAPKHAATLQVAFSKSGHYPYLSTVSGRGGVFSVTGSTPASTSAPAATTSAAAGTANTTVMVNMFDSGGPPRFRLSQSTMPSGMVTFVIANHCVMAPCSFHLDGIKAGTLLGVDGSETWTVALSPGRYHYHCDENPEGMQGYFTVTP